MKTLTRLLAMLGALALALFAAAASSSAAPYSNQLTVGVSNASPQAGATITVSGHGATPNNPVSFELAGLVIGGTIANSAGDYSTSVKVPSNLCGAQTITAIDAATSHTASTDINIQGACNAPPPNNGGGGLSSTGVAVASIGGLGVVLLLGGGLMLLLGRRRRATV